MSCLFDLRTQMINSYISMSDFNKCIGFVLNTSFRLLITYIKLSVRCSLLEIICYTTKKTTKKNYDIYTSSPVFFAVIYRSPINIDVSQSTLTVVNVSRNGRGALYKPLKLLTLKTRKMHLNRPFKVLHSLHLLTDKPYMQ